MVLILLILDDQFSVLLISNINLIDELILVLFKKSSELEVYVTMANNSP